MSITYSSGTITIAGETATPEDLWDADQAGGWGVVSRQGLSARYQYYIAAQISLGVGGHFVCEELDVIINGGNKSPIVSTSSDSGMRFGAIDANGDTYNGCSVTFVCTSTASLIEFPVGAANLSDACDFEVYASTVDGYFAGPNGLFGRFYRGDDQIVKIRDSTFQNMKFGMRLRGTASFMKDVEFSNISGIFSPFTTYGELGGGISGILVRKSYQGAYFQSDFGDATVRNFAARNNTRTMNFRNVAGSSGNYYSIDGNLETPLDIFWQFNNTVSKFFVQFSFNKTYKKASDSSPLEGARVYIEDADGTQATNATTNASGVLAEQVLTKETYRYLDGDTPTALTPHVVKVRKYGYLFTEVSISVDAKIEGVDFVGDNPFVVANEATAGAYTGIAINGAAKTIAVSGARTLQELYDYSQWWAAQSGNIQYDAPLSTADGVGFVLDSGWSMSVTGSLTGTGTLATKPTVASGGFFEDADGAIWEAGGSLYYAAHAYIRVKDAVSSDDIEGAVVGFGDGATQTRLLYNTSLAEDTLVTDAGGAAEGYFVYRIGATTYADTKMVVGEYAHTFSIVPRTLSGAAIGSAASPEITRLSVDAQVTLSKAAAGAITGIAVDVPTDTIDLGGNTLADAYDSLKYQVTADADIDTGVPGCMYACLYGLPLTKSGTAYTARSATTIYQGVTIGTDTYAGGIVEWDTPGTYADGTWNGNTFRFTAAGTYDFRAAGFIGTVVLTATVPGVIVQVAPSVSYDDTDPNVTVDASVAITIANANLIDGTRVQLYNVTQGTELENTIVSGGAGYSYVATLGPGQEVESGDTIRLRSDHIDSDELTEFGTASSAGVPFLGVPIADTVYPQWGVDGSTVTEFSADTSGHVQININDPDGKTTKRRLLAWLRWYTTTEDGIRSFFGALTTTSAADARINQDVVDLQLDNISGTKVTFTDLDIRLYRADNTDIIADSSDSIHLDYAGVPFVSVVTTSGAEVVDAAEVAGAIATTLSAQHGAGSWEGGGGLTEGGIATAVRAELGTELGRIDATISSRLATASYTAPPTTAAIDAALTATHGAGSWAGATAGDTAAAVRAELATELARVDVATSTRLASVDYTAPPTTLDIDAQLSLTHSAGSWAGATAEETATAVRSELDPELGRIDASVSTRLSAADYVAAPTPAEIDSALTAGHGAGSWAGATAAATAIAVRSELAVELAYMDIAISTRLADTDYSAPDNATLTIVKDILEADEELAPTSATKRHKDTKAILVQKTVSGGNNTSTISLVEA
jgi:hypothetical protein